jgi:hypothetical protein
MNTPASKSGFKEIPINQAEPSDIVIRSDGNGHNHAMMFNGYDKNGQRRYNHSNGGYGAEAMRRNALYPASENQLRAFRFTGTHQDSVRWSRPKKYAYGTDDDGILPTPIVDTKPAVQDAIVDIRP